MALSAPGASLSARRSRLSQTPGFGTIGTAPVVRSPASRWAAASTFTAIVGARPKSPVNARVSVARVSPSATAETDAMERSAMAVTSSKLAVVTPLAKAVRDSVTTIVAPCRLASASVAGTVSPSAAAGGAAAMRSASRPTSPSASVAETTTTLSTARVGVPQIVRGAVAQRAAVPEGKSLAAQPPASVPVASNLRPSGSPAAA